MTLRAVSAKRSPAPPALLKAAGVGAFLGGSAAAIYAPGTDNVELGLLGLAAVVLLHLGCGAAIGRWWAVLLPALVVLIAIPSDSDPDVPFWGDYLFFLAVPAALLLGLGVLAGRIVRRRRRSRLPASLAN